MLSSWQIYDIDRSSCTWLSVILAVTIGLCNYIDWYRSGGIDGKQEATNATAGLNLLASLLGASAKEETEGGGGDTGVGLGGKGQGKSKDSFRINLVPDKPFDAAQAKGDENVRHKVYPMIPSFRPLFEMILRQYW